MPMSSFTSNFLLAALAVVAIGTSGYAVWSVQQPPTESLPATTVSAPYTTATSTEPSLADEATPSGPEPDTDALADPLETTSGASATTDERPLASVNGWESAWSEDRSDLLVIGDGYSNLTSQWAHLWAVRRAEERPTLISHWGEAADEAFNEPIELSKGEGPDLHVWSASRDGTTIREAARRIDRFVDASAPPDAVLISLGGSSGDEDVAEQLDRLLEELPDVPVLVAAGPSGLYEPGVADDVVAWAEDNDDRVSLVDLRDATSDEPTAEEWALAFDEALAESD